MLSEYMDIVIMAKKESQQKDFTALRESVIKNVEYWLKNSVPSHLEYRLVMVAVLALLDECLMNAIWKGQQQWINQPLQAQLLKTSHLGEEFYRVLEKSVLVNKEVEAMQLYLLCLQLGFKGEHWQDDSLYREEIIRILSQAIKKSEINEDTKLDTRKTFFCSWQSITLFSVLSITLLGYVGVQWVHFNMARKIEVKKVAVLQAISEMK